MAIHKRSFGHRLKQFSLGIACLLIPLSEALALPVIPGAAGFGMDTPAGRDGAIYRVTNLNDSGSGSLKECVDGAGARVCVFEVSGTIHLSEKLKIRNPYLTIAGQTAPSPGITIRGAGLKIMTSHVLVQHLRFRTGDDSNGPDPDRRNPIGIAHPDNDLTDIVIDHNSLSWSIDQLANTWLNAGDVTFRANIFSEALDDSLHSKGPHSKGPLFGPSSKTRITMVGNLLAHNVERNPLSRVAELVFVNNVVYNWDSKGTDLQGDDGIVTLNSLVGNYYKAGVDTSGSAIKMRGKGSSLDMTPGSKVYVEDNITPSYDGQDPWSAVDIGSSLDSTYKASSPPTWNSGLNARSSSEAFDWVVANAGARPADRDSVDQRIANEVVNGNGHIIDSQSEVGGWPDLAKNQRILSLPSNPGGDSDGDGYTNLEEWLHEYAAKVEGRSTTDDGTTTTDEPAAPNPPTNITVQ